MHDAVPDGLIADEGLVEDADGGVAAAALGLGQGRRPVDGLHPVIDVVGPGVVHQAVVEFEEELGALGLVEVRQRPGVAQVDAVLGEQRVGEGRVEALAGLGLHRRAPEVARGVDDALQLGGDRLVGRGRTVVADGVPGLEGRAPARARRGPEVADAQVVGGACDLHRIVDRPEGLEVAVEGVGVAPERTQVPPERAQGAVERPQVPVEGPQGAVEGAQVAVHGLERRGGVAAAQQAAEQRLLRTRWRRLGRGREGGHRHRRQGGQAEGVPTDRALLDHVIRPPRRHAKLEGKIVQEP